MAVRLRLRRAGTKKKPMYHIVAADSRKARNGGFLEVVGRYEPRVTPTVISTKEERVLHWLRHGARPTETVRSLFQRTGLWFRWNLSRRGLDEGRIVTELEKWRMARAARDRREEERKARRAAARRKARKTPEAETAAPAAQT